MFDVYLYVAENTSSSSTPSIEFTTEKRDAACRLTTSRKGKNEAPLVVTTGEVMSQCNAGVYLTVETSIERPQGILMMPYLSLSLSLSLRHSLSSQAGKQP